MDIAVIIELISTLGFPVACVVALAIFAYIFIKRAFDTNDKNMKAVQDRCKEREDILFKEVEKNREVNEKAIDTIAHYAEKLDNIQTDISEIKVDIIKITERID